MLAIDTSAIIAILNTEPEEERFSRLIATSRAVVGAPTLVEARLVLEGRTPGQAEMLLRTFIVRPTVTIVPFDAAMFESAIDAFARFGKGRGHPAQLNLGDCLAYAVARTRAVPVLFKGNDFVHTDVVPADTPTP